MKAKLVVTDIAGKETELPLSDAQLGGMVTALIEYSGVRLAERPGPDEIQEVHQLIRSIAATGGGS